MNTFHIVVQPFPLITHGLSPVLLFQLFLCIEQYQTFSECLGGEESGGGVSLPGGTCPGGCTCPYGYLPKGVYLPGGVPTQVLNPPVSRMTDRQV